MDVSERERREAIASELADILHRQAAIILCNDYLNLQKTGKVDEVFRDMADEDEVNLRMIEGVINSFGLRVETKASVVALTEAISDTIEDESSSPLEQLGAYTLLKQSQALSCHLVHKSAQISKADIKIAIAPLDGVYAALSKQVLKLVAHTENFGVEWITGEKPATGPLGRARDAVATVAGAILSKAGKPTEDMNVMTVLTLEHRKVDALFAEIKESGDAEVSHDLFEQLKADLMAHSIAEEDTVYATFRDVAEMKEKVEHAQEEHIELRELLDDIAGIPTETALFHEKIEELKHLVQHHVKEEEGELFGMIRRNSSEDEQIVLSKAFLDAKRTLQTADSVEMGAAIPSQSTVPSRAEQSARH